MTEATCKRELEFEIPAENVEKATDKLARDYAKMARIPGFRPGKAPIPLIRRRFATDLHGEVIQNPRPGIPRAGAHRKEDDPGDPATGGRGEVPPPKDSRKAKVR